MTGQIFSVVIMMVKVDSDEVVWMWCTLHQLDLVVHAEYIKLYDD